MVVLYMRSERVWQRRQRLSRQLMETGFLLSPESKLYPSNFGPQIWFRPITLWVPRVAYVTSMWPPDILSYLSSASLEFRALQMSPTFHFFDVHAWCCLYFFGIISRENPLSYLSLLSSIFHPSPPELKNVAYFSFFRCTCLVVFVYLWFSITCTLWRQKRYRISLFWVDRSV